MVPITVVSDEILESGEQDSFTSRKIQIRWDHHLWRENSQSTFKEPKMLGTHYFRLE